ncbi:MAG: KxYKxGKxW signal peptide domain-containing protein [Clostridium sp.]|nr:KxYKxGKxW signal peptide domain-containing protein [[Clostridium] innocuum]
MRLQQGRFAKTYKSGKRWAQ